MPATEPEKRCRAYERDGFTIHAEPVIPESVVQRAFAGMEAVERGEYDTSAPPQSSYWNPGDPADKLVKIEMPQFANRAIMELVSHPALGRLAAEVTGARWVQVWWVQHLAKPPVLGDAKTRVGWHQDRNYWGIWEAGSELFTAWVAVSDVTEDSGPMKFVRGSNHWGLLTGSDFYGQDHDHQRRTLEVPDGFDWEEVAAILPPGGVSFHHCLTLHASGQNQSAAMRRSLAIHMRTDKSDPVNGERKGLASFIDDPARCPIIYRAD